ncbi:hypothetical protein GCM10022290_24850 [Sagittula marina]
MSGQEERGCAIAAQTPITVGMARKCADSDVFARHILLPDAIVASAGLVVVDTAERMGDIYTASENKLARHDIALFGSTGFCAVVAPRHQISSAQLTTTFAMETTGHSPCPLPSAMHRSARERSISILRTGGSPVLSFANEKDHS